MKLTVAERAKVLVEALPYIKRFHGQIVVVKVGGNAIEQARDQTLLDIVLLRYVGMQPLLVHGGGPEITAMSERLGPDMGFVGRVTQINREPITALLGRGYIPVIASIGLGYDGHAYNINADTVAAEIALALGAAKLILLTELFTESGIGTMVTR